MSKFFIFIMSFVVLTSCFYPPDYKEYKMKEAELLLNYQKYLQVLHPEYSGCNFNDNDPNCE